jgi:hypothetical protein
MVPAAGPIGVRGLYFGNSFGFHGFIIDTGFGFVKRPERAESKKLESLVYLSSRVPEGDAAISS